MQNKGRFGETRVKKVTFFCLFNKFLSISTCRHLPELEATENQTFPYPMYHKFICDDASRQLVRYIFFLQVKIKQLFPLQIFTTIQLDKTDKTLRNFDATFLVENEPLKVRKRENVNQNMPLSQNSIFHSFRCSSCANIVNSDLKTFERLRSCKILRYCYETG